jgi:alpha-galactosidase
MEYRSMAKPKLVIIGAGSIFFTRAVAIGMCGDPHYRGATLSLVDIDPEMLDVMRRLCQRIVAETGADLIIEATTDRREALVDADFVVLSFSLKGVDLRETETVIPANYGVIQCSGDTVGPGGLFRSIRSIPPVLEVARDIERICPDAWVFNYINPSPVIGAALNRYTKLKVLALCDGVLLPDKKLELMQRTGVPASAVDDVHMKVGGINHFSWVTELRHGDRDLLPALLDSLRREPETYSSDAVAQLLEVFGVYSAIGGHMVEFLPYFQGRGLKPEESYVSHVFEIDERRKWMREFNEEIRQQADGAAPITQLIEKTRPDLVVRIANSILDDAGDIHYVNFPNAGNITNLPEGAMIELPARIYADRYEGEAFGDMPLVLRSWLLRIVDVQELTLQAAMTGDRQLLRQALVIDPLTVSIEDAEHIIDDLLAAEADDLPAVWR